MLQFLDSKTRTVYQVSHVLIACQHERGIFIGTSYLKKKKISFAACLSVSLMMERILKVRLLPLEGLENKGDTSRVSVRYLPH